MNGISFENTRIREAPEKPFKITLFARLAVLYHIQQTGSLSSSMSSNLDQSSGQGHLAAINATILEPTLYRDDRKLAQGKLEMLLMRT